MGGACSTYGAKRDAYRVLLETWGKRTLGRPRRRWEDDIKMDLQIGVWTGLIWLTTGIGACERGDGLSVGTK
jgi:hypothetical protein